METRKIAFIGAGNIVKAILAHLLAPKKHHITPLVYTTPYPANLISICSPSTVRRDLLSRQYAINSSSDNIQGAQTADVIILAVKPQIMAQVCHQLASQVDFSEKLVISLAAGISCKRFYQLLGADLNLIRVMPNVTASVGKGTTGLFAPAQTRQQDINFANQFFNSLGDRLWLQEENMLNPFIAVSSSSPAYFFYFLAVVQKAVQKIGLDEQTASLLSSSCLQHAYCTPPWDDLLPAQFSHAQFTHTSCIEQTLITKGEQSDLIDSPHQDQLQCIVAQAIQAVVKRAEEMENLF